ncbi:T9SS type A sorting domain-containing protein [Owenweeksia hongkongensis]|uniref:T9SS type A sorting domain-containing protein n=1 Tax=Owenweeksia hongkongensis TaxID=253245 RepID=UPI003A929B96
MRKILITLFTIISINSFASHLIGGNITWENIGPNQYIFTLNLYRDCGPATVKLQTTDSILGPFGKIGVVRDTVMDLTMKCLGPSSGGCYNTQSSKGVEHHRYLSSVQTLSGVPPVSGWEFSWTDCCRTGSVINASTGVGTFVKSVMYDHIHRAGSSSPYYAFNPAQQIISINNSLSSLAQTKNPADSLYYDFTKPMSDSSTSFPFSMGYTATSPFPNSNTDPANGPVTINHNNGLIEYDVKVGLPGLYSYAVVVEQWREGSLLSEIFVDNSVQGDFAADSNSAPLVTIDTAVYTNISRNGFVYKMEALQGDTVDFIIEGYDSDINTDTNLAQVINFTASGYALDSTWNNGNTFQKDAVLTPVHPQSGFNSTVTNKVRFLWVIDEEHFAGKGTNHAFHFQFSDDQCPYVGMTNIIVEIGIKDGAFIEVDSVKICEGDTANLVGITASGKYLWTPSAHLSADSISQPIATPPTSQYYYLYDPSNPGFVDSIFVDVQTQGALALTGNGNLLTLTDTNNTTNRTWYFNGVPFNYSYDTLTAFGNGNFWVEADAGKCSLWSDTVTVLNGQSFSMAALGNGIYQGSSRIIPHSYGISFRLNSHANLKSVTIPGIYDRYTKSAGAYDLNLKLYDASQTELLSEHITLDLEKEGKATIYMDHLLYANDTYTLAITGGSSYLFSLVDSVSFPSTPFNNGITVLGAFEGSSKNFPVGPVDYLLPMGILTNGKGVGINEFNSDGFRIYPNPAAQSFVIEGLQNHSDVELMDVQGKVIFSSSPEGETLEIKRKNLPAGMYFVKISNSTTTSIQKVMFE